MAKAIHPLIALAALALNSCAQVNPKAGEALKADLAPGRRLFLKNCAHCHGAAARGDEGPDLHQLDWTDAQIISRIRHGKPGQMTAFAGKLSPEEISALAAFVSSLK